MHFSSHVLLLALPPESKAETGKKKSKFKCYKKMASQFWFTYMRLRDFSLDLELKTDSVQNSSNTCKNFLLKIHSQHGNFLNDSDPAMKFPSILEKFNVKLRKNAKSECYCVYN